MQNLILDFLPPSLGCHWYGQGRGAKMPAKHILVHHLVFLLQGLYVVGDFGVSQQGQSPGGAGRAPCGLPLPSCNSMSPCKGLRDSSSCYAARLDGETLPLCLAACFLHAPSHCFSLEALSGHNVAPKFLKKRFELWVRMLHCECPLDRAKQLEPADDRGCVCLFTYDKIF